MSLFVRKKNVFFREINVVLLRNRLTSPSMKFADASEMTGVIWALSWGLREESRKVERQKKGQQ